MKTINEGEMNYLKDRALLGISMYGYNSDFRLMYDSQVAKMVTECGQAQMRKLLEFFDDWDIPRFVNNNEK